MPRAARVAAALLAAIAAACVSAPVDDPREERAAAYERVGSYPEAAGLWTEIYFASGSRNREAGLAAARTSFAAGRLEESRVRLDDLDSRRTGDARVLELRGRVHEAMGLVDRAREDYAAALEADPDRPLSLARLGALDVAAGRSDEGIASLERAVALDPTNARAQYDLGLAAASAGRADRAAIAFGAACASDRITDAERLAAARLLPDDPRVGPWLAPIVQRDPQHTEALWRLGRARALGGRPSAGLELLGRAAESDPGDVPALVAYANGLIAASRADEARAIVEHARGLDLSDAEAASIGAVAAALEAPKEDPVETPEEDPAEDQNEPPGDGSEGD